MLLTALRLQVFIAVWTILSCLPLGLSQSSSPSNGSLPVDPNSPQLTLNTKQGGMQIMYDIDPLTNEAGLGNSISQLQQLSIVGNLILTTGQNVASLGVGSIAYICCDPSCSKGFGTLQQLLVAAAGKIDPGTQGDPNQGAIVLYSSASTFCTLAAGSFQYPFVYTMTNSSASQTLESALTTQGPPIAKSTIILDADSVNSNMTSQNALGPSPTTAVAMIILYSITGIITCLFLVIIITGAVRAHRHPERYGPRNIMGRPRQTRARGIARAMLESLPIVKFGEQEEDKDKPVSGEGDVELGPTRNPAVAATPAQEGEDSFGQHTVTTETAARTASSLEIPLDAGVNTTENGLACSVCTDDFVKGQSLRVLPCNHKFHPVCIDPWLLNVSGTCPLCRIDLRPTADRTEDIADEGGYLPGDLDAAEHLDTPSLDDIDLSGNNNEGSTANRRRNNGLSIYINHTLNFRRMRDATPEERLDALRRVRRVNRANPGDAEGADQTRSRRASRLSRLWGAPHADSTDGAVPAPREGGSTEGDSN